MTGDRQVQLNSLVAQRGAYKGQLTKVANFLDDVEGKDVFEINSRLKLLNNAMTAFQKIQTEIEIISGDTDQNRLERDDFEEKFVKCEAALERLKFELRAQNETLNQTISDDGQTRVHTEVSVVQSDIPEISLPRFDGNYLNWTSFINSFDALIHNSAARGMTDLKRFSHLQNALKDSAAFNVIKHLDLTGHNYEVARELLRSRFEKKRLIFEAYIKRLIDLPNGANAKGLRTLMDSLKANLAALSSICSNEEAAEGILIWLTLQKVDKRTHDKWEELSASRPKDIPTWAEFTEFLERRCDTVEHLEFSSAKSAPSPSHAAKKSYATEASSCPFCSANCKKPQDCRKFMSVAPGQRFRMTKNKVCRRCLTPLRDNHESHCKAVCAVCDRPHHELLHWGKSGTEELNVSCALGEAKKEASSNKEQDIEDNYQILATAQVKVVDLDGKVSFMRALIDSGSQLTLITRAALKGLNMTKYKVNIRLSGVTGNSLHLRDAIQCDIGSRTSGFSARLNAIVIPKFDHIHPRMKLDKASFNIPHNIVLSDPEFDVPRGIDMILGVDWVFRIISVGRIERGINLPYLQKTVLGWIVLGSVPVGSSTSSHNSYTTAVFDELQRFWEIDEINSSKPKSPDHDRCEKMFNESVTVTSEGKYQVDLLFKRSPIVLGDSYASARKCLFSTIRRLEANPDLKDEYTKFLKEYEDLGHMKEIELTPGQDYHYLPHHPVVKADSTTTKVRVVFNASNPTSSGVTLNDCLEVGPNLQPDIFDVLIRFRGYAIAVCCDIEKMYRQFDISPKHRPYQCILWMRPGSNKISTFELKTVTYGTSCASFLATRCLRQLALDNPQYHIASQALLNDCYVDDTAKGFDRVAEAIQFYKEITTLLKAHKMRMRKFCSNSEEFLCHVPKDDQDTLVQFGDEEFTKTLGLRWQTLTDEFFFVPETPPERISWTLRLITSFMAKIFDPIGLVCPIVVKMKILIQRLWAIKVNWDESIPMAENSAWLSLIEHVKSLSNIRIPRYVGGGDKADCDYELHCFSDASTKAYGCVAYVKTITPEEDIVVRMIAAKARVAPLKKRSLPRLELMGALIMAELQKKLVENLPFKFTRIVLRVDSKIALTWAQSSPHLYETFIANRITTIQDLTVGCEWYHIAGKENPADIVSRGAYPTELLDASYWCEGPSFLYDANYQESSPGKVDLSDSSLELVQRKFTLIVAQQQDFIAQLAARWSLRTLKNVSYYVKRFAQKCKGHFLTPLRKDDTLTAANMEEGFRLAIKAVQHNAFKGFMSAYEKGKLCKSMNFLAKLRPFVDKDGIMRVGGRLSKAPIPFETKYPILLPAWHALAELIVKECHENNMHAGPQTMMGIIRLKFWIINLRALANRISKKCPRCIRSKPVTYKQIMGDLPADRVDSRDIQPFNICGVDLFGPFTIKQVGRGAPRLKVYVALFVCFVSKALHLELVEDLSTAAFLNALNRFVSRRGTPSVIWSDNATNFQGAAAIFKNIDWTEVDRWSRDVKQITWRFIPARSPHFGGLWESSVKIAKSALMKVVGDGVLCRDELVTLLAMAEATANSRPLIPVSINPVDSAPLTPGHFCILRPLVSLPDPILVEPNPQQRNMTSRWKHLTELKNYFTCRYDRELLQAYQCRYKWNTVENEVKLDAGVLMVDRDTSPWKWLIARVSNVYPGSDGKIRVVEVTTTDGKTFKRAIKELVPIPWD